MTDTPAQADLPVEVQNDAALLAALRFNAGILASCGALSPKLAKVGMISEQVVEAADRIETLTRQLAEAREARQKWYDRYQQQNENWLAAERQIADLQSQLAAQRERDGRDAERWRFACERGFVPEDAVKAAMYYAIREGAQPAGGENE
jgi:putative ubiquitin-RnfH superfamily antitoxin RatB of RatAB toxin-antitoxin module